MGHCQCKNDWFRTACGNHIWLPAKLSTHNSTIIGTNATTTFHAGIQMSGNGRSNLPESHIGTWSKRHLCINTTTRVQGRKGGLQVHTFPHSTAWRTGCALTSHRRSTKWKNSHFSGWNAPKVGQTTRIDSSTYITSKIIKPAPIEPRSHPYTRPYRSTVRVCRLF